MSLKRRIAISLSIAFSLIFGIMMFIVYVSFNDFRKDEFRERFQKRLVFTVNFIEKSGDFEKEAPIFFDENSDNVLLKNAVLYSDNQEVDISIKETDFRIIVKVFSIGSTIPIEEREKLFEAFMRGSNSQNKAGSGLGLRIVKRILEYHKAEISYTSLSDKENLFTVIFNK